jgi:REP element-mobilizing transposase RayT
MPQSLAAVWLHLIFSTKDRQPYFQQAELRERVHSYLGGVVNGLGCHCLMVGGATDHVHLLLGMSRTLTIADVVRDTKRASSLWIKDADRACSDFEWQKGYGVFSISPSHLVPLTSYIRNQMAHHEGETFQVELVRTLQKYDCPYDERYLWE